MTDSAAWPDLVGRMANGIHILPVRVYYEDTDFSGFVYHANYLKFCERGRSDFLRLAGVHHHRLFDWGDGERTGFVVRKLTCEYLAPARIDDVLIVETALTALTGARLNLAQAVRKDSKTLFAAQVTAALAGADGRAKRLPAAMRAMLKDTGCFEPSE